MGFSFSPDIDATIVAASNRYGIDPNTMRAIAQIESAGNPRAQNPRSSAGGLYQFIDATANDYGLTNRFDPAQAADAGARLARDNAARLRGVLGREPTAGELYLAHQQGGGGASRLLRDRNARAVDIVGADAVRLNGGNMDMTAGEFANIWMRKADELAGTAPAGSAPQGPAGVASSASGVGVPDNVFQAALARLSGETASNAAPSATTKELTTQDRLAGVGASLMSLDRGGPVIPMQGQGGTIDLSEILNKVRSSPVFNRPKGLSL